MGAKLVVIEANANNYSVFDGRKKVQEAVFSCPLFAEEVEALRVDPIGMLGAVERANNEGDAA